MYTTSSLKTYGSSDAIFILPSILSNVVAHIAKSQLTHEHTVLMILVTSHAVTLALWVAVTTYETCPTLIRLSVVTAVEVVVEVFVMRSDLWNT